MKKYITLLLLFTLLTNCKAQMPIYDLEDIPNVVSGMKNRYIKDTKKLLDPYVGTYLFTNGNTSFKIVLEKKKESYNNVYFEDLIIGEYQYIENGIEKANTLDKLNMYYENQMKHNINANIILTGREKGCTDCTSTEKRLQGGLTDPNYPNTSAEIQIRRITVNGKAAITLNIYWIGPIARTEGQIQTQPFIGPGLYTLIKQ